MQDMAIVVGLLAACLVALILVLIARREAGAVRRQAQQDVQTIKDEARSSLADAQRREERVAEREQALNAAERALSEREREASQRERAVRAEAEDAAVAHREARERVAVAERELAERTASTERELAARHTAAEEQAAALLTAAEQEAGQRIAAAEQEAVERLEAASGLTASEARAELIRLVTAEATQSAAASVRRVEAQAKRSAEARARRIIATALFRTAAPTSAQSTVTVLPLPSEEMKGRIIGKEGRNIRTFEALTGVNVLVDETPGSVVLSCFDAERREVAQVALDALMTDGRINPQRIESAYAEALAGAPERDEEAGHDAAERAGVSGLDPALIRTLGRLRMRTSYGQNVLEHLVETALVAAQLATEVGADVQVTRRAAFLHDIGKALTGQQPGTHAQVGAALVERHGEAAVVVNGVAAHHDEVPPETVEAVLVQAADAVSAARPGARREDIDQHIERLDELEKLVAGHAGVRRALAMAAGRELRVVVEPSEVPDEAMGRLAVEIARHIEHDLSYPGEIKVTVVREVRASATAT
ncbi:ribonuclease Y [Cellulomonas denverensis]|uniref:Ribonuclease Y n=2 Tax=Cellulomonas denverensis TaxID=264297 RepID=A0A7X6R060_9CELL|nr:ribonuclease Y [Cellulomonas denverensis]GIG25191.1 ribonuclease Y [Cellulomonas denverensis]